jgi:hypothetical protein
MDSLFRARWHRHVVGVGPPQCLDDTSPCFGFRWTEWSASSERSVPQGTIRFGVIPRCFWRSWYPSSSHDEYTSAMYWEVWAIPTSNLITAKSTEADALCVVRELLAGDWTANELVMIFDDPSLADKDLPPGVTGEELARRAKAAGNDPIRRTA